MPFVLRGKLAGGVFGAVRFSQEGSIRIASLLPRGALSAGPQSLLHAARKAPQRQYEPALVVRLAVGSP